MPAQPAPQPEETRRRGRGTRLDAEPGGGRGPVVPLLAVLGLCLALGACDGGSTQPGTLRFGQVGEIQMEVSAPLGPTGAGRLRQGLVWSSQGPWRLTERVSYRGLEGDETVRPSQGDPGAFASAYASLVTLLNESEGTRLFVEDLAQELDPECGPTRSRVTITIRDERREETASWVRCASGTLSTVTPQGAGPDPGAARVVQAAILSRDFSLGESFRSEYQGTVPFGTLDRGQNTGDESGQPKVFAGVDGSVPDDWPTFWEIHAGEGAVPPTVDWEEEMVVVGAVGLRDEAGDSVEVRRILSVDRGSVVELYERVPGNFCSPADQTHRPFHIVVAPRTPSPVRFGDVRVERVPCGI